MAATTGRGRAAKTTAPRKSTEPRADNVAPGTHDLAAPGPVRTAAQIENERRLAQPHVVSGPEAGNRLLLEPQRNDDGTYSEQDEADLEGVTSKDEDSQLVVVGQHVYEEVDAPGAPGRKIQKLLYRKGRTVKKSELDRALAAQRKAAQRGDGGEDGGDGEGEGQGQ